MLDIFGWDDLILSRLKLKNVLEQKMYLICEKLSSGHLRTVYSVCFVCTLCERKREHENVKQRRRCKIEVSVMYLQILILY